MAKLPDAQSIQTSLPQPSGQVAAYRGGVAEAGAADMGRGFAQLGRDVRATADDVRATADEFQNKANEVWARDASTSLMLGMNGASEEYRRKEGMDAVGGYQPHVTALEEMRQKAIAAAPNPAAAKLLSDQSAYVMGRIVAGAQSYSAQQFKLGQERSHTAAASAITTMAINQQNDPDVIAKSEAAIRQGGRAIAEARGLHGEEADAFATMEVGKFYHTLIGDMMTRDPMKAQALFARVRTRMDAPSQLALDRVMEPKMRAMGADAWVDAWVDGEMGPVSAKVGELTPDQTARANLVQAGMVKRGWSPVAAAAFAANAIRESDAAPDAPNGDADGGGGLFQWRGSRLTAFRAKYGVDPRRATLDQQLDFANEELGTTEKTAGDAIRAAKSPHEAAALVSRMFLRPRDVEGEAAKRGVLAARMMPNAAPDAGPVTGAFPDESALMERAIERFKDDPEMLGAVLSRIKQRVSLANARVATERKAVTKQFGDAVAALEAGKDDIVIPADDIRRVFPAPQAEDMIEKLSVAKMAGQAMVSAQWGTPEELAAVRDDLATGTGPLSATLRARTGAPPVTGEGDTPGQFAMRQKVLAHFDQLVAARRGLLNTDPAAYVAGNPLVQEAARAGTPQDVARTILAVQEQMGVREDRRHVLSAAQAQDMVARITTMDPAKGDIGATLEGMKREWGDAWPRVWGDMVQLGKLPGTYKVFGAIDDPAARTVLQRALIVGEDKLKAQAGDAKVKDIDKAFDATLDAFRGTTVWNGVAGAELFNQVKTAAKLLSYAYAGQGMDASAATEAAIKGVLGRYEFPGGDEWKGTRLPKGKADEIQAAGATLKPEDLAEIPGSPTLTQAERQQELATALRRGRFVMNESDDGVALMIPLAGDMRVAKWKDGKPIGFKFNALPTVDAASVAAVRAAREMRQPPIPVTAPSNMPTFDEPAP